MARAPPLARITGTCDVVARESRGLRWCQGLWMCRSRQDGETQWWGQSGNG